MPSDLIAFIGGGNMAGAVIGGLVASGRAGDSILVVDPGEAQRASLQTRFGVRALGSADASLAEAALVVWAVKPQLFHAAAAPCESWVGQALQLSVMAGIRSSTLAARLGTERIVRAMPNTPALIGQGISGLFARTPVRAEDRLQIETVLAPTGQLLWFDREEALDAVTALSGSGPAYVFYLIEAMMSAAQQMGLSANEGRALALATMAGATALAQASDDPPELLRERVTSKGGTTAAAIEVLAAAGVKDTFSAAIRAAQRRAGELGDTFAG